MPASISNHFAITALQEGVTVQGSLRVNGTLSQNYNANTGKCIPDWKADSASRPVIYPVIRKGVAYLSASQIVGGTWLYNDIAITFDASGKSTNFKDAAGSSLFEQSTTTVSLGGASYSVPSLKILANLAGPTNIDLDTIGYQGTVEVAGKAAAFQAQVDVKIAQMTTQGYLGLLSPESAIITEKGQNVTIAANLYGEDGNAVVSYFTRWYNAGTGEEFTASRDAKSLVINEADVTDNIIIRCDFFTDPAHTNRVTSAFASIDDTQDPEYLYVSLNGSNSDFSGQLSPGDSCTVTAWVATMDDSTAINSAYTNFQCKLFDGNQQEITSGAPTMTTNQSKGTLILTYDFVASKGYKINGIVTAS